MTVPPTIDPAAWLGKYLEGEDGDRDLAKEMLKFFAELLMSAQASLECNAGYGQRTKERQNSRNGYRMRPWDTRVGTIDLAIPKLREKGYYPDFLLNPRKRAEEALYSVICQAYVEGVSTRRVDDLVKSMGIEKISKSEVSRIVQELDEKVTAFRERPLDSGPYKYLWIDAVTQKVREDHRVVNLSVVIATGLNAEGKREIVGVNIVTCEDSDSWTEFLRSLVKRGLSGVELVISDAHGGIKNAIGTVFSGATWQRCRAHFMANLASRVPKSSWDKVSGLVSSIFEQDDRDSTWSRLGEVVDQLEKEGFGDQAIYLSDAANDILAFASFPKEHWVKIRTNNPAERLNREIRRRSDVVGIFPNRDAAIRLIGAILAEQSDEWSIAQRYMNVAALKDLPPPKVQETEPRPELEVVAS